MADLRTRIAKVLCDLYEHKCCDECDVNRIESNYREYLDDADAVIRELNMVKEDGECSYCHAQLPGCRYICDWMADE